MAACGPLDKTLAHQLVWPASSCSLTLTAPHQAPLLPSSHVVELLTALVKPPLPPHSSSSSQTQHASGWKQLFLTFLGPPRCLGYVSFVMVVSRFNSLLPEHCLLLCVWRLLCDRAPVHVIRMHGCVLLSQYWGGGEGMCAVHGGQEAEAQQWPDLLRLAVREYKSQHSTPDLFGPISVSFQLLLPIIGP